MEVWNLLRICEYTDTILIHPAISIGSISYGVIHRLGMRLHMYGIPVVDGILKALVPILLEER